MARNIKRIPPLGLSSASVSMGSKDPRSRRNAQGGLASISRLDPLGVDEKGRTTVRQKATAVDPSTGTLSEVILALKEAGLMEQ